MIDMTLEIAEKAVRAAQARARELDTPITVTVVDEAGRVVLCARGDGAGISSRPTRREARRWPRRAFCRDDQGDGRGGARARRSSGIRCRVSLPGQIMPSTGGAPISRRPGRFIGAIGCGGGTGEQDHQCALAGAAAV